MTRINLGDAGYTRSFENSNLGHYTSSATSDFIRTFTPRSPPADAVFCDSIKEGTNLTNAAYQSTTGQGFALLEDNSIPLETLREKYHINEDNNFCCVIHNMDRYNSN